MGASNITVRLRLVGRQAMRAGARAAAADISVLQRAGARASQVYRGVAAWATKAATAVTAASVAVGALGAAIAKAGVQTNITQDRQRVAFTVMLRSAQRAKVMMADIRQLAIESPILDPVTAGAGAQTIIAYGVNAKQALPWVKALGDMSAASGRNFTEVMPLAAKAIGQIASKGRLQTGEMNQLAESVGLSRNAIRRQLKMSRAEFENTFTPGNNIKASKALPAIMRAMRAQSKGAAEMLSQTTEGQTQRLKEIGSAAAGDFTRPFFDAFGRLAGGLAGSLQKAQQSGQVKGFARGLFSGVAGRRRKSGGFTEAGEAQNLGARINGAVRSALPLIAQLGRGLMEGGRMLLDAFKPAVPFLQNILLPLLGGIAKGVLGGVVGAFRVVVPVIKAFMQALGWIGTTVGPGAKSVFSGIGQVIGFVFGGVILKAISALGKLGKVFGLLRIPINLAGKIIGFGARMLGRIFGKARDVAGVFRGPFAAAIRFATDKISGLVGFVGKVIDKFKGVAAALGLINKEAQAGETTLTTPDAAETFLKGKGKPKPKPKGALGVDGPLDLAAPGSRQGIARRQMAAPALPPITVKIDGRDTHRSTATWEQRKGEAK